MTLEYSSQGFWEDLPSSGFRADGTTTVIGSKASYISKEERIERETDQIQVENPCSYWKEQHTECLLAKVIQTEVKTSELELMQELFRVRV